MLLCFDSDIRRRRRVKVVGEFEAVESKLVVSLCRVSVSVEVFLRPVVRLKRPETVEDTVPLEFTEGVRIESLRCGAGSKSVV
jgi:hypothetical protein